MQVSRRRAVRAASPGVQRDGARVPQEPRPQSISKFTNPPAPPSHTRTLPSGGAACHPVSSPTAGWVALTGSQKELHPGRAEPGARPSRASSEARGRNPKGEGSAAGGLEFAKDRRHMTQRPLPAREEDVAGVRAAPGLGPVRGAVPRDPSLQWGRGRLLHSGPEPRAPHARVLLLRGPPGPGGPEAGRGRAGRGRAGRVARVS